VGSHVPYEGVHHVGVQSQSACLADLYFEYLICEGLAEVLAEDGGRAAFGLIDGGDVGGVGVGAGEAVDEPGCQAFPECEVRAEDWVSGDFSVGSGGGVVGGTVEFATLARVAAGVEFFGLPAELLEAFVLLLDHSNQNCFNLNDR
jgi:hypothetical protein